MSQKYKTLRGQSGFTIIEVLIVLAIAGLILLIVFLAVPALQRNSRNTQRSNDVSGILGALNEYVNNNNGQLPAATCNDKTGAAKCDFLLNVATGSYLDYSKIRYNKQASASAPAANTNLDSVEIYNFAKCNGNASTATGATQRSLIVLYAVETGGGNILSQCKES